MPFDVDVALHTYRRRAAELPARVAPELGGVPAAELHRSPAASLVAEHAAASGLFLYHFEHRSLLALPEDWLPLGRPDLGAPPVWQDGVLPEPKYQSFRHDLPLGSFHPGHRAKWSTHELCHGLVGFAMAPSLSRLDWMDAARLAELLPVALWYFLDECYLGRCPVHQGQGALFRTFCADCEAVAGPRTEDAQAKERLEQARRYLDGELAAVARTRRTGVPQHHRWATLDLCSDALAYVAAHGDRLQSVAFSTFVERFTVVDGGRLDTLEALEARVVATARAITEGTPLAPLAPTAVHGRWRWVAQDLAWRLLQVQHQTEGELHGDLDALLEPLEALVQATTRSDVDVAAVAEQTLARLATDWQVLVEDYVFPDADELFAVGYPLPALQGASLQQLLDGLVSGLPRTTTLLQEQLPEWVAAFSRADNMARRPLALRFSAWLQRVLPGPIAELCRYEAYLSHLPARDAAEVALGASGVGWRQSRAWRLLETRVDVAQLHEDVGFGDVLVSWHDGVPMLLDVDGSPVSERHCRWALGRGPDGTPAIIELADDPERIRSGEAPPDPILVELGVFVPERWN